MNAVMLCPGPSLALLDTVPPCDLSIAVNGAAFAHSVQWFACMDYPFLRDHRKEVLGAPALFTFKQTWADISHRVDPFARVFFRDDLRDWAAKELPGISWEYSTFTASIVFVAWWFANVPGPHRLDIYGADMSGTQDFDGETRGQNRSESRWVKERTIFEQLTAALVGKVEVARHLPHQVPVQ